MSHGAQKRWLASALKALTARWPRLRPLLPAAVLAATWPACHAGEGPLVAFLGDSLTSGWRLSEGEAYPTILGRTLTERGRPVRVFNAGVSGDTTAQGLARLPDVLAHEPDVLVVALGVNDGHRGRPLEETEAALRRILEDGRAAGAALLLVGVRIPENALGAEYARRLEEMYARLAAEYKVALVPDLLAGVADHPELLFHDRLHPNAAGHVRLAENVRRHLELVLATVEARRAAGSSDPAG
jgi:acyl-CoA thioesterase-1